MTERAIELPSGDALAFYPDMIQVFLEEAGGPSLAKDLQDQLYRRCWTDKATDDMDQRVWGVRRLWLY